MRKTVPVLAWVVTIGWFGMQSLFPQSVEGDHIGFSLSGPGDLGGIVHQRGAVLCYGENEGTRLLFSEAGIAFMVGDVDGDGLEDLLENIDALHVADAAVPGAFHFSTAKDGAGVLDGDLFRFHETGGVDLYLSEADIVALVGSVDGNVDVDAFTLTPSGDRYFSFADKEESTLLSGSQPGVVEDGDILLWDAQGLVKVLHTEAEVSQMISNATGQNLKAGDVLGLSWDSKLGCLLFTVQSPSDHDASVFSTASGGSLVAGYDEASLGFNNTVEIDALSVLPTGSDLPALDIEPRRPAQGDSVSITVSKGVPAEAFYLFLSSARAGTVQPPYLGGFRYFALERNDPYFLLGVAQLPALTGAYNLDGIGEFYYTMPMDPTVVDIHIQAVDPNTWVFSHPVTMEYNQ